MNDALAARLVAAVEALAVDATRPEARFAREVSKLALLALGRWRDDARRYATRSVVAAEYGRFVVGGSEWEVEVVLREVNHV